MRAAIISLFMCALGYASDRATQVRLTRVPEGGLQPQVAVDSKGAVHLIYFKGDPKQGDVYYARSVDGGTTFQAPIRVNSQAGSAIAIGTIRGPQMALGKADRVYVVWNGSAIAEPKSPPNAVTGQPGSPMLFTRLNDEGTEFEPQRNLMQRTYGLDGGGSVAADRFGRVYVGWHGKTKGDAKGEAGRAVWIARSDDEGKTFTPEARAWNEPVGACGCCGMRLFADRNGTVYALFRSATKNVHRDIYLLVSKDHGKSFRGTLLQRWEINACPMSSMSFAEEAGSVVAAWETQGQVFYARIDPDRPENAQPVAPPGPAGNRKHPIVAAGLKGEVVLVWAEGTGWQRGGSLSWQVFDERGGPLGEHGTAAGIPVWSFASAFLSPRGTDVVIY